MKEAPIAQAQLPYGAIREPKLPHVDAPRVGQRPAKGGPEIRARGDSADDAPPLVTRGETARTHYNSMSQGGAPARKGSHVRRGVNLQFCAQPGSLFTWSAMPRS